MKPNSHELIKAKILLTIAGKFSENIFKRMLQVLRSAKGISKANFIQFPNAHNLHSNMAALASSSTPHLTLGARLEGAISSPGRWGGVWGRGTSLCEASVTQWQF